MQLVHKLHLRRRPVRQPLLKTQIFPAAQHHQQLLQVRLAYRNQSQMRKMLRLTSSLYGRQMDEPS